MPRWLYGSGVVIYLAGTFGFGLSRQIYDMEMDVVDAITYGASWPLEALRILNIL